MSSFRDQIARIIDPEAFETYAAYFARSGLHCPTDIRDQVRDKDGTHMQAALAKADRILALSEGKSATEGEWRPIETAPKDGTEILIYRNGWQEAPRAKWGDHEGEDEDHNTVIFGGWFLASDWQAYGVEDGFLGWNEDADVMPTHWMPLPASPTGEDR